MDSETLRLYRKYIHHKLYVTNGKRTRRVRCRRDGSALEAYFRPWPWVKVSKRWVGWSALERLLNSVAPEWREVKE
jgi:hypothetical protein